MNCFEWSQNISDYLDSALSKKSSEAFNEHLKACASCREKLSHFEKIIDSIKGNSVEAIPQRLLENPLSDRFPSGSSLYLRFLMTLQKWKYIPWYVRTLLEGVGIVVCILISISSAPRLRALYEMSLENRMKEFKETTHLISENDGISASQSAGIISTEGVAGTDEISGEDEDDDDSSGVVGSSELWRFTLKTVSPDELRPVIIKTLRELGVSEKTPGIRGVQVPGGIEFDLVLPQTSVHPVKQALQKISPQTVGQTAGQIAGDDAFSWYRVKSRRKLPTGHSQVVIWLSQPTP